MKIKCPRCGNSFEIIQENRTIICPNCWKPTSSLTAKPSKDGVIKKLSIVHIVFIVATLLSVMGVYSFSSHYFSNSGPSSTYTYEHDLEERCKDWIYCRNKAYKLGREGDIRGAEEARRAMVKYYNDLLKIYPDAVISATISKLEDSGYKVGF